MHLLLRAHLKVGGLDPNKHQLPSHVHSRMLQSLRTNSYSIQAQASRPVLLSNGYFLELKYWLSQAEETEETVSYS